MADKTKAVLVKELAAANRRASKAEKALAVAQAEAEEGVASAQATIADLEAKLSGRAHNADGHVCPRTGMALGRDADVYATEKRLRAERNDWRSFSGGVPGMRGTKDLPQTKRVPKGDVPQSASVPSVAVSESALRSERNAARKAAGGYSGQRGPNGTSPGKGLSTIERLRAERDAWLAVTSAKAEPKVIPQEAPKAKQTTEHVVRIIIETA